MQLDRSGRYGELPAVAEEGITEAAMQLMDRNIGTAESESCPLEFVLIYNDNFLADIETYYYQAVARNKIWKCA